MVWYIITNANMDLNNNGNLSIHYKLSYIKILERLAKRLQQKHVSLFNEKWTNGYNDCTNVYLKAI
jgi:hypothetical protein